MVIEKLLYLCGERKSKAMEAKPYQIHEIPPMTVAEPAVAYERTEACAGLSSSVREGYIPSEEFWTEVEKGLEKICEKYGVL